jgi:autophagy-related protein 101
MDQRPAAPAAPPEFMLDAFSDPASVRDVVRGILHTIFFNRFLQSLYPRNQEVLDISLPYVQDAELETMIDQRTSALVRQLDAERHQPHQAGGGGGGGGGAGRGQVVVQFFERRRRKASAWNMLGRGGDEEVCWESWTVKVTVAEPRTESGMSPFPHIFHLTIC